MIRKLSRCRKLIWLFLLLLTPVGSASAAAVEGLYEAVVPVFGQDAEARSEGIRQAFRQVLVKVTGNRAIVHHSALGGDWSQASRYVQQYTYEALPGISDEPAQPDVPDRLLKVAFDAGAISRLLRERRLPQWGDNRPGTLVWLGIEQGGHRRLALPDRDQQLFNSVEQESRQRGLPLVVPLMDLEDQAAMKLSDLWGDFEQNIRRASDRYSPDAILTGRLAQLPGGRWRGFWRLYQGDRVTTWSDEAGASLELSGNGINHAVDLLAERFVPMADTGELAQIRLQVSGVSDLTLFSRVESFVRNQNVVDRANLVAATADSLTFELRVRGGLQALQEGLKLGGLIEPAGDNALREEGVDLLYTLR